MLLDTGADICLIKFNYLKDNTLIDVHYATELQLYPQFRYRITRNSGINKKNFVPNSTEITLRTLNNRILTYVVPNGF